VIKTKKVCGWCQKVMKEGEEPISHGICKPCSEKVSIEMDIEEGIRCPNCKEHVFIVSPIRLQKLMGHATIACQKCKISLGRITFLGQK
jgi:DNA-directed RNA polymerase subunit RPC12/RpoP